MNAITRPPVRWHGGKFLLSRDILPFFPKHRCYTETFGGGAGVLLHKDRSAADCEWSEIEDPVDFGGDRFILQSSQYDRRTALFAHGQAIGTSLDRHLRHGALEGDREDAPAPASAGRRKAKSREAGPGRCRSLAPAILLDKPPGSRRKPS